MSPECFLRRFWARVDRSGGAESCWPWTGASIKSRYPRGIRYGVVMINYTRHPVRRIAYEIQTGRRLTRDDVIGCTCGNSLCCNIRCLVAGDWKTIGGLYRGPLGVDHPHAKLSPILVRAARENVKPGGWSIRGTARRYAVDSNTIRAILKGRTWRHVS